MEWNVYENGELINTIVADEEFAKQYAEENGYTVEDIIPTPAPDPIPIPEPSGETTDAELAAAIKEGVDSV